MPGFSPHKGMLGVRSVCPKTMRPAVLAVAFALAAAASAARVPHFNSSMLRSQLPADSPLLALPAKTPILKSYDPVSAKLFVYFSGAAYCAQSAIMDW